MHFKIHRGTREIGGTCVEVWTDSTRIVVDLGMPLVNDEGQDFDFEKYKDLSTNELVQKGVLPNVTGLYQQAGSRVDGILISHYHQDHHGLLSFASNNIPIFAGEATQRILEFSEAFFHGKPLSKLFQNYSNGESFVVGDITIHPYLMDHSAFDAYAFLIEANGKRLFYSGDFRGHGRKKSLFQRFLHDAPQNIDYLLMEGTTIGREQKSFPTESELEKTFTEIFLSKPEICLVNTSAQNIDRLVTIYRACKRANRLMVVDVYTAAIMEEISSYAAIPHPSESFPEIKVMYPYALSQLIAKKIGPKFLYKFHRFKISKKEISSQRKDIVFLVRPSMKSDLDLIPDLKNGNFIYSMWGGYIDQSKTTLFIDEFSAKGFSFHHVHTSGHADVETLKKFVNALRPKNLVPIHTFDGDQYNSIFKDVHVHRVNDREAVEI